MSIICSVISWINNNAGFFSLIMSTIAVCISIDAISAQNKAAVFDKRLEIYLRVENVYNKSKQVLKLFDIHNRIGKSSLAEAMLDRGSRLYDLAEKVLKRESQLKESGEPLLEDIEFCELTVDYYEYCIFHEDGNVQRQVELFFKDFISIKTYMLFDSYSNLKSEFLAASPNELNKMIDEVRTAVKIIEDADILKKMRNTFPL